MRVVLVRFVSRSIGSEALFPLVIIMIDLLSLPFVTLDPKMIVSLYRQGAVSIVGFKTSLGKGNAGGNPHPRHLTHGQLGKGLYILFPGLFLLSEYGGMVQRQEQQQKHCCSDHCFMIQFHCDHLIVQRFDCSKNRDMALCSFGEFLTIPFS